MSRTLICKQCGKEFKVPNCRKNAKFCSISCGTTYRNITNNPTKSEEVRKKISENHANVSGANNPMYGRKGVLAPSYKDGRNSFSGEIYRRILKANNVEERCVICGKTENLDVHHINGNHKDNTLNNLTYLCKMCHLHCAHQYQRDCSGRFIGSELKDIRKVVNI